MWSTTPSRVATLALAAVAALSPLTFLGVPAEAASQPGALATTEVAAYVARHPQAPARTIVNRSETRAWSHAVADRRTARSGRRALLRELAALPPAQRRFYRVGRVRHGAFTFSAVGERSCLSWPGHRADAPTRRAAHRATRTAAYRSGGCHRAHANAPTTPLRDAAAAVAAWSGHKRRTARIEGVLATVDVRNLARTAGFLAPRGVRITGVGDGDGDGLDDDARVAFRKEGRVVCAQLAIAVHGRSRFFRTPCSSLPRRDLTGLRRAYDHFAEYPTV